MLRVIALALLIAAPLSAHAQPPAESMSKCLADNTSGKDRKDLARWIFLAMAAHPEIKQYASEAAATAAEDVHRQTAGLVMRLLTESCPQQTQAAAKEGGSAAIKVAFQLLGQLAMQELMSDPSVSAGMGAFERHLDEEKLGKVLHPQ